MSRGHLTRFQGRLSPRERRTVLIGALTVLPALCWTTVARPTLSRIADDRAALELERALLLKEREVVARRDETAAWAMAVSALEQDSARFFEWRSEDGGPTSAVIELDGWVQDAALSTGVWVDNLITEPDSSAAAGVVVPVTVKLAARSTPAAAAVFFGLLERGEKLMRVERLRMMPLPDGSNPGQIAFDADIVGFMTSAHATDGRASR